MKMTKSELTKTVDSFITEKYGEIVIERKNISDLKQVLFSKFDNISCCVEDGIRSERFVVSSINKRGETRYLDLPIIDSFEKDYENWNIDAVIHEILYLIDKYGIEIFKDCNKASDCIGTSLIKFSNEAKVMKMLFREGLSEVLGDIPYVNEKELNNSLHRIEVFMLDMGMSPSTIIHVKNIVKKCFIDYKNYKVPKEQNKKISKFDFLLRK